MSQHPSFACEQCGSQLQFEPGTSTLVCTHCGHKNHIQLTGENSLKELPYDQFKDEAARELVTIDVMAIECDNCGAETTLNPNIVSDVCPFCDTPFVQTSHTEKIFKPQGVIPFLIDKNTGMEAFTKWLHGLWFAPNSVKELALEEHFRGVYYPFWTYDADTFTRYSGHRGDYYYTTESYQAMENGRMVTKRKKVRHTRWSKRRGAVTNVFDDVLVPASATLAHFYSRQLEPWDLNQLQPYNDAYLSGFQAESYSLLLDDGFKEAKHIMDGTILSSIRRDIGGDEQRVTRKETHYDDVTFKHILLPVWINAYHYKGKVYRFMVNGATGKVHGERPFSSVKIALAVTAGLILILIIVFVTQLNA